MKDTTRFVRCAGDDIVHCGAWIDPDHSQYCSFCRSRLSKNARSSQIAQARRLDADPPAKSMAAQSSDSRRGAHFKKKHNRKERPNG